MREPDSSGSVDPDKKRHRRSLGKPNNPRTEIAVELEKKDVLVIAWIDPDRVTVSPERMGTGILLFFPPNGRFVTIDQRIGTTIYLASLAAGANWHPVWSRPLDRSERSYILNWLFKFGSNRVPGTSTPYPPPDSFANEAAVKDFIQTTTRYKLLNWGQFGVYVGKRGRAKLLQKATLIGTTLDPIWGMKVDGESTNSNGADYTTGATLSLFNYGNPDSMAVKTFNTLISDIKLRWTDIGSVIHQSLNEIDRGFIEAENYPTYYIYERVVSAMEDGPFILKDKRLQALDPALHCKPKF